MRRNLAIGFVAGAMLLMAPYLSAQTVCPGYSIVINTPEDELTLAYNGAENPQDQVAAVDKFMAAHADSKFVPCALEYYTMAYLKLNNFDKVIEHGEKALSLGHRDMMTSLNLAKAYVGSGKIADGGFEAILGAAEIIKTESNPSRNSSVSDEDWKKELEAAKAQANDWRAYMEYAFFQLIQREPDASKRLPWLDKFAAAYPDTPNAGQLHYQYFLAYKMSNQPDKAIEAGEKAVAADPNNLMAANLLAYDLAFVKSNADRAEPLARKALELAQAMKKPEQFTDEQFKTDQNNQLGMAHLVLGYAAYAKASAANNKKIGPSIEDLKAAADLLPGNPTLQAQALYLLGNAYEYQYPPSHKLAIEALTRGVAIPGPFQAPSQKLLSDVKKAAGVK
jgi:tetratricopeptide (TPR) repeat protein